MNHFYEERPPMVEAVQFIGREAIDEGHEGFRKAPQWFKDGIIIDDKWAVSFEDPRVNRNNSIVTVPLDPGQWAVKDHRGVITKMDDGEFSRTYKKYHG